MPRPSDPPWKVKTRPCPFFSRGTCLFSASCNFVHTVKSPLAPEIRITESRDSVITAYGYQQATTPPTALSPTFSDRPSPDAEVQYIAPQPREWDQTRRMSWTSIHSIASADSNLTYPTDLSPTASRASSPDDDGMALPDNEYTDIDDTFHFQNDARTSQALTITNLNLAQSISHSPTRPTDSAFLPPDDYPLTLPAQLIPASASTNGGMSTISDPDGQVLAFSSTSPLGEPFRLHPAKPPRSQASKDSNTVFRGPSIDLDDEIPGSIIDLDDESPDLIRRHGHQSFSALSDAAGNNPPELYHRSQSQQQRDHQLSLNEVLLNLQDPTLRPRRINRLMQGLSPETPLNSVMPSPQVKHRPLPFQGDGDWKSDAFRKHLATLISSRSAMVSSSLPHPNVYDVNSIDAALQAVPDSAPAMKTQFRQLLSPHPVSTSNILRFSMVDVASPDGSTPAFKRPQRPARKRTGFLTPVGASPILPMPSLPSSAIAESPPSASSVLASPVITVPIIKPPPRPRETRTRSQETQAPPAPFTPPKLSRLGSLTGTPVHDSPGDFRNIPRTVFTPLEDDDALATLDMVDGYADAGSDHAAPTTQSALAPPTEITPKPNAAPSQLTVSEERSPSPKLQLRPLRLSMLFDQAQKSTIKQPAYITPGSTPSSAQHQFRRPLTALLAEEAEEIDADATPSAFSNPRYQRSPSPTPRRHRKKPSSGLPNTQISQTYPLSSAPARSLSHIRTKSSASASSQDYNRIRSQQPQQDIFSAAPIITNAIPAARPSHIRSRSSRLSISSASSMSSMKSSASSAAGKPLLIFAIAKDDPQEVERLLASGEATANDRAGPDELPALLFAMGNDGLKNKTQIVKTLLAYGADLSVLQAMSSSPEGTDSDGSGMDEDVEDDARRDSMMTIRPGPRSPESSPTRRSARLSRQITMDLNPEIGYYLSRAKEMPAKQLEALRNAGFDPLTRTPFILIGQDLVLQELLRVLARHSQRGNSSPVSIIFAGPSGHGKSLLSRSIGELLRIPAHTVNMTNLRTQDELLQARSLTSTNGDTTLAKFLDVNEGKRCAVILEEIEKVADKSVPNTLLMPWELGKLNTSTRLYDTSNVIWISTSNAGEDIVFDFERNRGSRPCERNDYLDLATSIRRKLIDSLGASLVSRITTVLPFLAFTDPEKLALAYQHLPSNTLTKTELDLLLQKVVQDYIPSEGVRSIQRAVQRHFEEDFW